MLFTLVDHPAVASATIAALLDASAADPVAHPAIRRTARASYLDFKIADTRVSGPAGRLFGAGEW